MAVNASNACELLLSSAESPLYGNQKDQGMTTKKVVIISILTTSNIFMLLGNSFSAIIILRSPSLRKHTYYWLVLNLAVLDLMNSLFVVPINIVWEFYGNWPFSQLFCNIEIFFDLGFGIVATYSTILLSLDKYIYIARPFTYFKYVGSKMTLGCIVATWVVWMAYSAMSVFGDLARSTKAYKYDYPLDDCNFVLKHTYAITSFILVFFIPVVILTVTSTRIFCVARQHIRKIRQSRHHLSDKATASHDLSLPSTDFSRFGNSINLFFSQANRSKLFILSEQNVTNSSQLKVTYPSASESGISPDTTLPTTSTTTVNNEIQPHSCADNNSSITAITVRKQITTKNKTYRAFGTVILVVGVFMVMFAPYWIASIINLGCVCIRPMVIENYLAVFYYMHSLVNPYIYMATDSRYKKAIWRIIGKYKCCKQIQRNKISPSMPLST